MNKDNSFIKINRNPLEANKAYQLLILVNYNIFNNNEGKTFGPFGLRTVSAIEDLDS